jgi:Spy/CpxP family protein refolding chaperone
MLVLLILMSCVSLAIGVNGQTNTAATTSANTASSNPDAGVERDIQLMREDVRSKKKQLIAANLKLTDTQATKFWPVYDQYAADLVKINDGKYALIKEYAEEWGKMSNAQALSLAKRALDADEQVAQLRTRYVPIFNQAVDGKTTATFFQIERRIQSMIDLQVSSQLPLVQD